MTFVKAAARRGGVGSRGMIDSTLNHSNSRSLVGGCSAPNLGTERHTFHSAAENDVDVSAGLRPGYVRVLRDFPGALVRRFVPSADECRVVCDGRRCEEAGFCIDGGDRAKSYCGLVGNSLAINEVVAGKESAEHGHAKISEAIGQDVRAFVETDQDHHHIASPDEVAETVVWLCADANHLVNGNIIRLR